MHDRTHDAISFVFVTCCQRREIFSRDIYTGHDRVGRKHEYGLALKGVGKQILSVTFGYEIFFFVGTNVLVLNGIVELSY